jgi:GntR family transcriptional regulator of vanillate catabolism
MAAAPLAVANDRSPSQTLKAQLALRELILGGELKPGERISELPLVERLGVSRTPVRMALVRLEEEGLLESLPSGGFVVSSFSERDVFDAIEIRGTLEGLAARLAAERGLAPSRLLPLKDCLAELDDLIASGLADLETAFSRYIALNARFHALLLELAASAPLARQLDRIAAIPFASPSGFVMAQSTMPEARTILTVAQDQHRCVVEAIENREGGRAEMIMREHARLASRNLRLVLRSRSGLDLIPGASLITVTGRG